MGRQDGNIIRLFPRTYLVSKPLLAYYYTQFIGDAKKLPVILASADFDFTGLTVPGGAVFGKLPISLVWHAQETHLQQMLIPIFLVEMVPSGTSTRTTCKFASTSELVVY